ncbi:TetR/AcrR family transcriptional regulator [Miniphocaeibacter massiliensis]|uniref:TetR/AcrR family transcriptional regulator n=1 Tax=Miniphocaeibacter massiliensis TaxID=2041841 RepID=UPI000C1BA8BE|nr:TetR/AcrR family transcriptional regulator [Miniphocaeibacter massiliensis]
MNKNIDSKIIFINSFKNLMKNKSIRKITATDLINESGLSRQTFYRHFTDMDDFIYFVHNETVSLSLSMVQNLGISDMTFKFYLQLMLKNKKFYTQVITLDENNPFTKLYFKTTKENIKKYIFEECKDIIDNNEDLKFSLDFYSFGFSYSVLKWIKEKNPSSPEKLSKILIENMPEPLKKLIINKK